MTGAGASAPDRRLVPRLAAGLLRLASAAALLTLLGVAARSAEIPLLLKAAGVAVFGVTLAAPSWGLLLTLAAVPLGETLAPAPAGAAEALAWCFLAAWLAALWRPLGQPGAATVRRAGWLYAAALVTSWLGLILADAGGIPVSRLPGFLLRALSPDYLVFSSPEPETWSAVRALTGLALFGAALALARLDRRLPARVAATLTAVGALLGLSTLAGVARAWAGAGYGGWFLWRYVTGVRYSQHLTDLNAAGSLFVLGALVAAGMAVAGLRRGLALLALIAAALMLPALWLSGSRSAIGGAAAAGAVMLVWGPLRRQGAALSRRVTLGLGAAAVLLVASVAVSSLLTTDPTGTASASLSLRSEFTATSARMLASAPVFGVGVGRYYPRSPEFMSARLHAIYPYENAHNYLFQQFAELGVVGGSLFLLLIATLVGGVWRALRTAPDGVTAALLTGAVAYLTTCLTGHPLLVPEAAFPFWIVLGAAGAAIIEPAPVRGWDRWVPAAAGLLLAVSLGTAALRTNAVFPAPPDRGFHDELETADGVKFRWTTRHAVAWVQSDPGFLTIDVQAPVLGGHRRPFVVTLEADGRVVQRATIPAGRWSQVGVYLPARGLRARRRIDLRVNQVWTEKRDRPGPGVIDDRPRGVMAGYPVLHESGLVTRPR